MWDRDDGKTQSGRDGVHFWAENQVTISKRFETSSKSISKHQMHHTFVVPWQMANEKKNTELIKSHA